MIILLGGSGYVGLAYQKLFTRLGVPFRNLARKQVDYTDSHQLADLLAESRAEFLINAAGYTGKAERRCLRERQGGLPVRQRRAARTNP